MSEPFAHQDASGLAGAPLAVFVNGEFHAYVDTKTDPHGDATARQVADLFAVKHAIPRPSVEALITCINHPKQSAVDCTICWPLEDWWRWQLPQRAPPPTGSPIPAPATTDTPPGTSGPPIT